MRISDHIEFQTEPSEPEENEPKFLYIANMHGDEVVGRELTLHFIETLLSDYGHDNRITNLVDHSDLFVMPSMNPDGFELGQRHNRNGRDLNRNFPDFTSDPSDTQEGREPETKAVMNLHALHHFVLAANFHGGEVCMNIPWDTETNGRNADKFGDDRLMNEAGRNYTVLNAPMYANHRGSFDHGLTYGYEWYEVDGGMQDWANYYRRSIHATVELSKAKWPSSSTLAQYWVENRESMLGYAERSAIGAHLVITDENGMPLPIASKVVVRTQSRETIYDGPYIHRPLPNGTHDLTIEVLGRAAKRVSVTAELFAGEFLPVMLESAKLQ